MSSFIEVKELPLKLLVATNIDEFAHHGYKLLALKELHLKISSSISIGIVYVLGDFLSLNQPNFILIDFTRVRANCWLLIDLASATNFSMLHFL